LENGFYERLKKNQFLKKRFNHFKRIESVVIWVVTVLIIIYAIPAFAQQEKDTIPEKNNRAVGLDEIIIEGNRIQVPFSQITRDIQVITRQQIEELPVKSLNEILSYVSGIEIKQRGPFGTQADISIDGGTFEQAILLINGVKMIDAQTAHNMMNIPVSLSAIDHIEILRGAAARVYGINALAGAINIVTRRESHSFISADFKAGSSLKQKQEGDGAGIYGGGGIELTGNRGSKNQNHLLSIAQNNYNGERYNSASKKTNLFYNGNYAFGHRNSLQAMIGNVNTRFGANGFYAAPGDINSEEIVSTSLFSLSSKHQWNHFTISPRVSVRHGKDDYRYYKDNLSKARSLHTTNALMLELNSSIQTETGTFGFGWESRLERINSSNIGAHKRDNHGAFAELKSSLNKKMTGTIGLYSNYNTDFGWQFYPGLDVAWFTSDYLKVSASVGSAERIPSFTDLYLNQLPGNIGNESLRPENAWNYEVNIQYNKDNLNFQTGYFFRNITAFIDWVRQDESHPYSPLNMGGNKTQGIYGRFRKEFDLNKHQRLSYQISYNYLYPRVRSISGFQSKYVLESLKHQFIAGLNFSNKKFSAQIENRLLKRILANAYDVTDIRVNYQLQKFLYYVDVTNLFNARYREAGAVPMPTRWFSVGVKYKWRKTGKN